MGKRTPFDIIRMDPLGQGVSLLNEKVTFIPKTLPGEKGEAIITETKGKKVQFAQLDSLTQLSPKREKSPCPHFDHCQGCSFLHTSYEEELKHKHAAYSFLYKNFLPAEEIKIIQSEQRLHYRNRIQLHYEGSHLGMQSREGLLEVKNCQLPHPLIAKKLQEIYEDPNFLKSRNLPDKGHLELSLRGEEVNLHFDERYSSGGFRQVNEKMGDLAAKEIEHALLPFLDDDTILIDLFGGSGYLSHFFAGDRLVVDQGEQVQNAFEYSFLDINLYSKFAAEKVEKAIKKKNWTSRDQVIILDPPRSGLKNCDEFLKNENIKAIAYLSCNPHSQVRDLKKIHESSSWKISEITFLDFFPATHHLESLVVLKRP